MTDSVSKYAELRMNRQLAEWSSSRLEHPDIGWEESKTMASLLNFYLSEITRLEAELGLTS